MSASTYTFLFFVVAIASLSTVQNWAKARAGERSPSNIGASLPSDNFRTVRFQLKVPIDAVVIFNGYQTNSTGENREFQMRVPMPGSEYEYAVTAKIMRNGKELTDTKQVITRAGQTHGLHFFAPKLAGVGAER
jgi:uncharacterized protein (TIGR03000 family)